MVNTVVELAMKCHFQTWQVRAVGRMVCGMATAMSEWRGLEVRVDDVLYMPTLDAPKDRPHPFVYFISIHNFSAVAVTIRGRKWVIEEPGGEITVVEGEGVVGQSPRIEPGDCFSYNSYHVVAGDSTAVGAFFGETANGKWIFTRIPPFRLIVPRLESM